MTTTTPLHNALKKIESFDLICLTRSSWTSTLSCQFQKRYIKYDDWAHIAIILKNDILPDIENKIYMLHASFSGGGIEMCDFEKYIYLETSKIIKIGWCKLKNNPLHRNINDTDESYNKRIKKIKKKITEFTNHTKKSKFDYFMPYLVFPFLSGIFNKQRMHVKKSYFCSNFITNIYQIIDVIDKSEDPDTFFPGTLIKYTKNHSPIFEKIILLRL
jgi:hypothetical protein